MRRQSYNLSHEHKLSADMGQLVPVATVEVLPGDTFIGATSIIARIAPQLKPVMHKVEARLHHWYVPNRITWSDWEGFITGENEAATMPTVQPANATEAALLDHMGIYPDTSLVSSALSVRAYNTIWNEWYRDNDLQVARGVDDLGLARVNWERDMFTMCRDEPQQGAAVSIGFSAGTAPVLGIGIDPMGYASAAQTNIRQSDDTQGTMTGWEATGLPNSAGQAEFVIEEGTTGYPNIYANLAGASGGIDLNELRTTVGLMRFAEARSRYGSRYVDYLKYLGVNPSDGRLDRPEFLGGSSEAINFSEVLATAEGTTVTPGDMFGHGIGGMRTKKFRKMFEEHGWYMCLLSIRPRSSYMEAWPRQFRRTDHMDYWQRELEELPWQEVVENEVYAPGSGATIFGYAPRYEEYRRHMSYVSGSFRTTENDWHFARSFSSAPTLNGSFLECTPTDRVYADTSMPEVLVNAFNNIQARRIVGRRRGTFTL